MSCSMIRRSLAFLSLMGAMTCGAIAESPIATLFPGSQDRLCFSRQYDAAHLKKIPGQRVTGMLASVVRAKSPAEGVWLRARFQLRTEDKTLDVAASCDWSENANFDTAGKPLLPTYRKKDGFACIAIFSSASAEEAGAILFDIPPDGKTATLHFDTQIGIWAETNPVKKRKHLNLGKDDRLFRLDRVADTNCAALIDEIRPD